MENNNYNVLAPLISIQYKYILIYSQYSFNTHIMYLNQQKHQIHRQINIIHSMIPNSEDPSSRQEGPTGDPHPPGKGESKLVNAWMAQKAGMKNIDKEAIARKVEEITRGTNKALHQKQLETRRNLEIAKMRQKIAEYHQDPQAKSTIQKSIQKKIETVEMKRDLTRTWAHFDFDMFYIACQLLDHPDDIHKPCAVGGMDSVLCTANYVARQYGVRSAIPTFIALKLCPQLVLYKPDFSKYKKYSKIMREIMKEYDEDYESMGLDEIYIEITKHIEGMSPPQVADFVKGIRERVYNETGLTLSGGVGANKQLCKMASEENKPNGQFIIENNKESILKYLNGKTVRSIPGIGPVTEHYLKGLGVETISGIMERLDELSVSLNENTIDSLLESCLGIDRNYHVEARIQKSISRSETFKATSNKSEWDTKLMQLCEQVSRDLNEENMLCLSLAVTYQTDMYQKKQRGRKLENYINQNPKIIKVARELLSELNIEGKVRLLGVKCSHLVDETQFRLNSLSSYLDKRQGELSKKQDQGVRDQKREAPAEIAMEVEREREKQEFNVPCPICNKIIETKGNNIVLNKHIDQCLQGGMEQEEDAPDNSRQPIAVTKKGNKVKVEEKKKPKSKPDPKMGTGSVRNYFQKE